MTVLRLSDIRKRFGATVALDGVDLDVRRGEVLAVIGENGAGKSTLLNIVAGQTLPDSGHLQFHDRGIAYIRQELSLFPHLSVAENILMGSEPSRLGFIQNTRRITRARDLLAEFGRPEIDPGALVRNLPPAGRQVVEICRALAVDAKLILMDEPTSSLQRSDVDLLFASIRKLCARGISILYVSHFLEEIREISERAMVLRDGKSVWLGSLVDIDDDGLIAQMVGRTFPASGHPSEQGWPEAGKVRHFGEVALFVDRLQSLSAVHDASFTLRCGEILGIAGLVGSGRTEMVRALFGLEPITSGTVKAEGGLGYLSEDRKIEGLLPHLSVRDNIMMTRPASRFGWIMADTEARQAADWIAQLKIRTSGPLSSIRQLSGGNQQKVLLARLLQQNAGIFLLDEPTRGIDIGSKAEIYARIRQMAADGKAILMVSSYLPELFGVCDSLAVMSRGRLSPVRPIGEWTTDSVLQIATSAAAVQ